MCTGAITLLPLGCGRIASRLPFGFVLLMWVSFRNCRVDHFQPFPFVTVRFTAYEPSGNVFASSIATRRDYNYQAGVRQELQDEDGAVMSMVVGERRQFVVPVELAYKRKLFGSPVPQRKTLLVDVELLGLQPY
mmetsp:Transcript_23030/g.59946  ORF Transcript_23030/g.59946 Transcript_23030/m.59946 type:complete len:134 (+) Transcript_23030:689-1090(+)